GVVVPLPARAFACLLLLVEHRDRAVGRDELIEALWPRAGASDAQLGQLIVQCRRALDDDGQAQRFVRTVPGFGYQWVAATEPVAPAPAAAGDDGLPVAGPTPDAPSVGPDSGRPRRRRRAASRSLYAIAAFVALAALGAWRLALEPRADGPAATVAVPGGAS